MKRKQWVIILGITSLVSLTAFAMQTEEEVRFEQDVRFEHKAKVEGRLHVLKDGQFDQDVNVDDTLTARKINVKKLRAKHIKAKKLKVTDDAEFKDDVLIEEDLTVEGDATVEGTLNADTLGAICNLTVGCNILMNNSTSPLIGNILKNNIRFIHNFGTNNTFVGQGAGNFTLTGNNNSGYGANTLAGLTSGSGNIAVGSASGSAITSTSDNIDIGNAGVAGDIGTIRIGTVGTHTRAFLQGVYGVVLPGPGTQMVVMDPSGQLGTQAIGGGGSVFTTSISLEAAANPGSLCVIFSDNGGLNEKARICSFANADTGLYISNNGGITQNLAVENNGNVSLAQSLELGNTDTLGIVGNIFKAGVRFLHNAGTDNTFLGENAGNFTLLGTLNTGLGVNALTSLSTGQFNTAVGDHALQANTTGSNNTAVGKYALFNNTLGINNIALGSQALYNNIGNGITEGQLNIAIGVNSLFNNTVGSNNVAIGDSALQTNISGMDNIAIGSRTLFSSTTPSNNIAIGTSAQEATTTGINNIAIGYSALAQNTTGGLNIAIGTGALLSELSGTGNVAIGDSAQFNNVSGSANITIGTTAGVGISTGSGNIYIGDNAGGFNGDGSLNIYLRNQGPIIPESNTIRIGTPISEHFRCFIAGIRGVTTDIANAVPVLIDSAGQLGTISSSKRFKHDIQDIGTISALLHKLRPVMFKYKSDATNTQEFGLIAEEVEEVLPELVIYDENGEPLTVKTHVIYALLLNEIQRNRRDIQELQDKLAHLENN